MIQRVIFTKLSAGQLDESGLTLEDLRVITTRMASTLVNMYHGRIKYPWQREAEKPAAAPVVPPVATPSPPAVTEQTNGGAKPTPEAKVNDATTTPMSPARPTS